MSPTTQSDDARLAHGADGNEPDDLPLTIAQLPFFASGRFPKPNLIGMCHGGSASYTSGRELLERVRDLSLGLTAIGMARGERVVILSENRPEWLFADFAIQAAGAVTVPIYPTLSVDQVAFILRDCEAAIAVVSTHALAEKLAAASVHVPSLRAIVAMDVVETSIALSIPLLSLADVAQRGHARIMDGWGVGRAFHDGAKAVEPSDLATIIYTSGTTGEPKGVMLTHENLIANLSGVRQVLTLTEADVALSFLPLCHAFERLVAYVYLAHGVSIVFAETFNTVARDLEVVRPTLFTGVPRLFEKLHARVVAKAHESGAATRMIFDWAAGVAERKARRLEGGGAISVWLRIQAAQADRLVFRRVREALGGRLRMAVSGAAPLRPEIGRFFYGMGLPILEGYGLTETAPVLSVMPLNALRFGTVGPPLPNVTVRIADDGEILAKGPNVMAGYYGRPAETAEVIRDGWLHTGDIGSFDEAGYLRITDRKKELIVTSGGKKIAPQPIEAALRENFLIVEAVLVGEQRHFPSVLIVPNCAEVARRLNMPAGAAASSSAAWFDQDDVRALFEPVIAAVNGRLAQFERIKRFALLPAEFSVETGELTPTLKVKRRVIEEKYGAVIAEIYAASPGGGGSM